MAVNDPSTAARIERLGMRLIQPQQGLQALQHALSSSSAVVAAVPFIWPAFMQRVPKESYAVFEAVAGSDPAEAAASTGAVHQQSVSQQQTPDAWLQAAAPPAAQRQVAPAPVEAVSEQVTAVVQSVLGEAVPLDQPLMSAGLDSLGAVELRNSLEPEAVDD